MTVKADDGNGGTDTIAVTINVNNVTEFDSAHVPPAGTEVVLGFIENLSATPPPNTAITVSVDGEAATVQSVRATGKLVQLSVVNQIRQGQIVKVSYTDPTEDNDDAAIQDEAGDDAASFTDQPVDNRSTLTPYRPRPPTLLTATADGSTRIDLSWTAPVDNGGRVISGYRIQISPDGRQTGLNVIWNDVVANTNNSDTIYTETGLSPGTTRYYSVMAINSEGISEHSNVATGTTLTTDGTPSAPWKLEAEAIGKTRIDLSWTTPGYLGTSPLTGYRITISRDEGNTWDVLEANTSDTATTYEHTSLVPGTIYFYRIFAINSNGASVHNPEPNGHVNATTFTLDAPDPPVNLRVVPGDRQVTLIWEPPTEIDELAILTGYDWKIRYGDGVSEGGWNPALVFDCNPCQRTVWGYKTG